MAEEKTYQSYYRDKLPALIKKLKNAVDRNMEVIDQRVESDLTEDKLHNVLKARRMAAEDTIYYMKEIDRLEGELSGNEIRDSSTQAKSFPKRIAANVQK